MKGISKRPVTDWLRFKLIRWTYTGFERYYFSAIDTDTAIAYAKQRTRNWDNAKLIQVHPTLKGGFYFSIWRKEKEF